MLPYFSKTISTEMQLKISTPLWLCLHSDCKCWVQIATHRFFSLHLLNDYWCKIKLSVCVCSNANDKIIWALLYSRQFLWTYWRKGKDISESLVLWEKLVMFNDKYYLNYYNIRTERGGDMFAVLMYKSGLDRVLVLSNCRKTLKLNKRQQRIHWLMKL